MNKIQNNPAFLGMLPYLLVLTLFISFFVADFFTAHSGYGEVPDGLPSNLFIAEGIIFIIINLAVFFIYRKHPKSVIFTTIAMALMVGFELMLASIDFVW